MSTVNGIGTKFYGFSKLDDDGSCHASLWLVFIYLPIFPLYRAKIKRMPSEFTTFIFTLIQKEKLVIGEVLMTYFTGWILTPMFVLTPLILAVPEVGALLNLPKPKIGVGFFAFEKYGPAETLFALALIWFIVSVIIVYTKVAKKGLPTNWKQVAHENEEIRKAIYYKGLDKLYFQSAKERNYEQAVQLVQEASGVSQERAKEYVEYTISFMYY